MKNLNKLKKKDFLDMYSMNKKFFKKLFSKTSIAITATLLAGLFFVNAAQASEPKLISKHNDWSAFTFMENGQKVCFMASQPESAKGNYTKRGEIFALITHRPGDNSFDVVSFVAGYTYKKNSDVNVTVGNKKFTLFTQADTAWTSDNATDKALTNAIKNGNSMVVKGSSTRGTLTTDTYSLSGSTAAYQAITNACK